MNEPDIRLVEFLLVEDNSLDAEATILAAEESQLANRIHHVTDGEQALDFLHRRPPFEEARRPDMILLDLNLPGIDGREVLSHVKSDDALKTIPVCILTSSAQDEDILRSYELHANAYVRKPFSADGFNEVVRRIKQFWVGIVVLPDPDQGAAS